MDTTPAPHLPAPTDAGPAPAPAHLVLGVRGEDLAAEHLAALGWSVLARNWRLAEGELRGELDLVCRDGDTLVVVEVKTRRTDRFGAPMEAVGHRKQAKIRRLAAAFLRQSGLRTRQVRFDVVSIVLDADGPSLVHVRAAF